MVHHQNRVFPKFSKCHKFQPNIRHVCTCLNALLMVISNKVTKFQNHDNIDNLVSFLWSSAHDPWITCNYAIFMVVTSAARNDLSSVLHLSRGIQSFPRQTTDLTKSFRNEKMIEWYYLFGINDPTRVNEALWGGILSYGQKWVNRSKL